MYFVFNEVYSFVSTIQGYVYKNWILKTTH